MQKYILSILVIAILTGYGCKHNQQTKNDTDNKQTGVLIRFDKELFAVRPDNLAEDAAMLRKKYGDFFELYCTGILGIAGPEEEDFPNQLMAFLNHDIVKEAEQAAMKTFANTSGINVKLKDGFEQYASLFPDRYIPKVYAYISGFNQSLMLTDSAVGVSLDMFLGRTYQPYSQLGIHRYKQKNMYKERIPAEVIKAWAVGEYPWHSAGKPLLAAMLHEGRLLYYAKTMLPNEADTLIIGFTQQELKWCEDNERSMWMELAESGLLYETSSSIVLRMIEDSPFTPNMLPDTPGRACCWIGYRIIQAYMKRSKASLNELMTESDFKKILETSRYNP